MAAVLSYRLADHVYACRNGGDLVVLDLKRDRYLGIDPSALEQIQGIVAGLPAPLGHEATNPTPAPESDALHDLLALGMLEPLASGIPVRSAASIARPEQALIEGYVEITAPIRPRDVLNVLSAVITAAILIRYASLQRIVGRLTRRRPQTEQMFDEERTRQLMAIYRRLRALLYTERDACLFSSLAAREFLACYGVHPRIVFGVTTRPFAAHCWLQLGDMVINDIPERVREFTPILVA